MKIQATSSFFFAEKESRRIASKGAELPSLRSLGADCQRTAAVIVFPLSRWFLPPSGSPEKTLFLLAAASSTLVTMPLFDTAAWPARADTENPPARFQSPPAFAAAALDLTPRSN